MTVDMKLWETELGFYEKVLLGIIILASYAVITLSPPNNLG